MRFFDLFKKSQGKPGRGHSSPAPSSLQESSQSFAGAGEPSRTDDDSGATQLMTPRAMVGALVNELLVAARMPASERSTRLYSLSSTQEEVDKYGEQFVLLVKFRVDRPDVWPRLPALGDHLCKQIKQRLGIRVEQVFWSVARDVRKSSKIPAAWVDAGATAKD